ncbi:MaoC family dehydratase [Ornithinimicrobium faecis]|uniref:MaoC family dehydratase n=1 Tax=Ornithinimicrobium faecis TaxID=2934158 RepID=UPI002119286F|nr:MaoC family dehydratase [Ornithinimicrobium sp. HY1745]
MITVGEQAPALERTIGLVDMVAYAGATWDWHRMHYDPAFTAARGMAAPVVDGQVFGALLAEQLQDWFGPRSVINALSFRFKNLVFAGEAVRCASTVTAVHETEGNQTVELECTVIAIGADGAERVAVAPAAATVQVRR